MPRIVTSLRQQGVGAARNLAARSARGDVLLITDAHVELSEGWDREVVERLVPGKILAAAVREHGTAWHAAGCRLVVPWMGTHWETTIVPDTPVQVASSAGTVLERSLFEAIGGYDEGMVRYAGFEPEFSVRAWRYGAEIVQTPSIEITHRFKGDSERRSFVRSARAAITHNCLRFAVAHLPEPLILEAVRLHALEFPDHIAPALRMLERRGAWKRREQLERSLPRDFAWFAQRFSLRDQIGEPLPLPAPGPARPATRRYEHATARTM